MKILLSNIYIITFVYLAVISQVVFSLSMMIYSVSSGKMNINIILIVTIFCVFWFGYFVGKKRSSKSGFFSSFFPSFLILIPFLTIWLIDSFLELVSYDDKLYFFSFFLCLNFPIYILATIFERVQFIFFAVTSTYFAFIFGLFYANKAKYKSFKNNKLFYTCVIVSLVLLFVCLCLIKANRSYIINDNIARASSVNDRIDIRDYRPFANNTKITKLKNAPTITFENNHPKLDGATALFPIYASAAEALYKNVTTELVVSSKTPNAYKNLIDGKVDMIFVAEPSKEQEELAKEKGVELKFVPIAKEAFVFFVNNNNSVNNLNIKDIQDIYSGKVKNWSKLGGKNSDILAFQRPVNSGSQTIMLSLVMKDTKIKKPLQEEIATGMDGIIKQVAEYKNIDEAIGYSFRFYATVIRDDDVKLLDINGIAPSIENIQNGSYPFIATTYIVHTENISENGKKLIEWFLSKQGQELIKDVGYVPIL